MGRLGAQSLGDLSVRLMKGRDLVVVLNQENFFTSTVDKKTEELTHCNAEEIVLYTSGPSLSRPVFKSEQHEPSLNKPARGFV